MHLINLCICLSVMLKAKCYILALSRLMPLQCHPFVMAWYNFILLVFSNSFQEFGSESKAELYCVHHLQVQCEQSVIIIKTNSLLLTPSDTN